jgi:hypothetical protein
MKEEGDYELCLVPAGAGSPAGDELPVLLVTVDRTAPRSSARMLSPADGFLPPGGEVTLTWESSDDNLSDAPVTLQWREGAEGEWRVLESGLAGAGRRNFPLLAGMADAREEAVLELRFLSHDRAGNQAAAPAGTLRVDRLKPVVRFTGPASALQTAVDVTFEAVDRGPAGLVSLELWLTEDGGRTWRRSAEQPETAGRSVRLQLPGPGRYGMSMAATDAAGNRLPPPAAGQAPQFSLVTDLVPPRLRLTNVDAIEGGRFSPRNPVAVRWSLEDDNLAARPVTLEFSSDAGAAWTTAAAELANASAEKPAGGNADQPPFTGSCLWMPPAVDSDRCKLRLKAIDVMGNCAVAETELFTVDCAAPGERPKPPEPRDLLLLAEAELRGGLRAAAIGNAGRAIALLDARAEPGLLGRAHLLRGRAAMAEDWPAALADFEKAAELIPDAPGLDGDLAHASYEMGRVRAREGRLPEAMKLLSRATNLYDRVVATSGGRASSHYNLAQALVSRASLEHRPEPTRALAEREFLKALELARKSGERNLVANACCWLAGLKEEARDFRAAAGLWKEAADSYEEGSAQQKDALARAALARRR